MSKGALATTGTVAGVGVFCTIDGVAGLVSPSITEDLVGVGVLSGAGTAVTILVGIVSDVVIKL